MDSVTCQKWRVRKMATIPQKHEAKYQKQLEQIIANLKADTDLFIVSRK